MATALSKTNICFSDAVDLARLIRTRKLSAVELMTACLAQAARINPQVNAICTLLDEDELIERGQESRRASGRFGSGRTASRPSARGQGSGSHGRYPHHLWIADLPGQHSDRGCTSRRALEICRRHHHRQNQHTGIRCRIADVQSGLRTDEESLRPDENMRRQQRRGRGFCGLRHDAVGRRKRPRRVAPQPAEFLRRCRIPTIDRPRPGLAPASHRFQIGQSSNPHILESSNPQIRPFG